MQWTLIMVVIMTTSGTPSIGHFKTKAGCDAVGRAFAAMADGTIAAHQWECVQNAG